MRNILQGLFKKDPAPAGPLTAEGLLASDLWVDRPDAPRRIERMVERGEVSAAAGEKLAGFVERGYLTFPLGPLGANEALYAAVEDDVERAWRERPADLAYAWQGPLRSFAYADPARDRRPSYRIADLHSHSQAALALYLHREVFAWVERILGEPPVATQSLYFEYGSQQGLHRDPVFVQTRPPSHLVAAWIALEDVGPRCGPLVYVPGSHRLPYYQFEPGEHRFDQSRYGDAEARAMAEFDRRQFEQRGMTPEVLTCPRGEVLLWHSSLLHGGSPVADPSLTRKSFVVHFSTLAHYRLRRQGIVEFLPGEPDGKPDGEPDRKPDRNPIPRNRILETTTVLERDGCRGFDSPMRGYLPPGG